MPDPDATPPPIEEREIAVPGPEPAPRATLRAHAGARGLPALVVIHGFKGFRDWGFFPYVSARLARTGFAVLTVDLSHNGIGEHRGRFDRLDLFEANSLAIELADLRRLLDAARDLPALDPDRVLLLGHSRGGSLALLHAAGDPAVRAVATWSAVADWSRRYPPDAIAAWERDGRLAVPNQRTGQILHVGRMLLDEWRDPARRFDPVAAAAAIDRPVLLVHGTADESVDASEAGMLAAARARLPTRLELVPGAGHTYGAVHPFAGPTPALERAVSVTAAFLGEA